MIEIKSSKEEGIMLIEVIGEVDASSSIHLDNALNAALNNGEKKLMVNLEGLAYISSAGLGVFISHLEEFEGEGIQMILFGLIEAVKEVFQILGLEKLLVMTDTKEEAIAAFK